MTPELLKTLLNRLPEQSEHQLHPRAWHDPTLYHNAIENGAVLIYCEGRMLIRHELQPQASEP